MNEFSRIILFSCYDLIFADANELEEESNFDLSNIYTPVNVKLLEQLLTLSKFDNKESKFLVNGFKHGFSLDYEGPMDRNDVSENIPLRDIGTHSDLWSKVMKEVKAKRFAGPYEGTPPLKHFVQSPIGLVPKAGNQTRLIFHLSYKFKNGNDSINSYIPREKCSVKYHDVDHAVNNCLRLLKANPDATLWFAVADLKSAFRMVPLAPHWWGLLVMKARHPKSGKWFYFIDKCLPFGAAISCAIFQRWLNALTHITNHFLKESVPQRGISNYLDDFFNVSLSRVACNTMILTFHRICDQLGVPLAKEKTVWATVLAVFLGILLDGKNKILAIPQEKIEKAQYMLRLMLTNKKTKVKEIEKLTGLLNFLGRAVYPGRAFTCRMYCRINYQERGLKKYHHVNLNHEFRADCKVWLRFLSEEVNGRLVLYRPFIDISTTTSATEIGFYTDSSAAVQLGCGGVMKTHWFFGQWEKDYVSKLKPSIEYLELLAVCIGAFIWSETMENKRILIHCDNMAVVSMINKTTSSCQHCMHLIRLLVLRSLQFNFRIFAVYVKTGDNGLADSLSRLQFERFRKLAPNMDKFPEKLPWELWPPSKLWNCHMQCNY